MASTPASQQLATAFDASRWLAAWAENGGIYMLVGMDLHLRRLRPLDQQATSNLDRLRDQMLRSGGGPSHSRDADQASQRRRAVSTDPVDFLLRAAMRLPRRAIERLTDALIVGLDALDGDADLEPDDLDEEHDGREEDRA